MKGSTLQVLCSWLKAFVSAILAFVLLQYSNGLSLTDVSGWALLGSGIGALVPAIIKFINSSEGWFNSFWGGVFKTAITVALGLLVQYLGEGQSLFEINWAGFVNTAIPLLIPSIINALNPEDSRYGLKKE